MTDYWQLLVAFAAAINPTAVALAAPPADAPGERPATLAGIGLAVAAGFLVVVTLAATSILDGLEIEPESFRIAAGIVLLAGGAQTLLQPMAFGTLVPSRAAAILPLGMPLLASPAALAAAISFGADAGEAKTIGAFVPSLVVAALLFARFRESWRPACDAIARVPAVVLIAIGAALIVDGVRAI